MECKRNDVYNQYMYSYPHKTSYDYIEPVDINSLKHELKKTENSLYVHIPFCTSKCGYCNLFSVTGLPKTFINQYIDAVLEQIKQLNFHDIEWSSLILGGGTPLILEPCVLDKLFHSIEENFNFDFVNRHSCVETSPCETTGEKLEILKKYDIKRVSIGIQSFIQEELDILKRTHNVTSGRKSLDLIKQYDFPILNIDIIYGIPEQTEKSIRKTLDEVLYYEPDEIFAYPLYRRKDSTISSEYAPNKEAYNFYFFIKDYLLNKGYIQTSMRRFTRNKKLTGSSCGFENTISLGVGGRTYIGNRHLCTPYTNKQADGKDEIIRFMEKENKNICDFGFVLNQEEERRRFVIKNILFITGINEKDYKNIFESDLLEDFPVIVDWIKHGYCKKEGEIYLLTPEGISLSDYLGPMLISDKVKEKMDRWKTMN